jgi:hypothetical protein
VEDLILKTGIDNSKVPAGLTQFEAMIDAKVRTISAKLASVGKGLASFGGINGGIHQELNRLESGFSRVTVASTRFTNSLNGMSRTLTGGLGIAGAVGGLGLLEAAFSRALKKAEQFQTAQLSIAAQLQSQYKVVGGGGKALTGVEGFQASLAEATKLNEEIIKRSRINILTYEEQLSSFRAGMAPGANTRGLNPEQIMKVTEQIGVAAKAMGITGEDLANSVRLVMSGRQNLQRSQIGAGLGITNASVKGLTGQAFIDFIGGKTKGFEAGAPEFEKSLSAQLTTFESQIDVWLAKVGQKMFTKLGPALKQFEGFLEGPGGAQLGENLAKLFENILKGVEAIAKSPAIPVLMKFIEFLAANADKLVIGVAFLTFGNILKGLVTTIQFATEWMTKLGSASATTGGEMAAASAGAAGFGRGLSRGPLGGAAGALAAEETAGTAALGQAILGAGLAREIPAYRNVPTTGFIGGASGAGLTPRQQRMLAAPEEEREAANAARFEAEMARQEAIATGFAMQAQGGLGIAEKAPFNWKGFGQAALNRAGGALQGGLYGEIGNLALTSMFPNSPGINALAGTLPLGGAAVMGLRGLTLGGVGMAPVAGAGIAGWGIGSAIQAETNGREFAREDEAEAALAEQQQKYPLAAKMTQLRAQQRKLDAMMVAANERHDAKAYAYLQGRLKDVTDAMRATQEKGGVTFVGNLPRDFSGEIDKQKAIVESYKLGYGPDNQKALRAAQQKMANLQIQQLAAEGKLEVTPGAAGQAAYNWMTNPALKKKYNNQEEYAQFVQANQFIEQQRQKAANEERVRQLQQQAATLPLGGGTKLEDQLNKQLLESEASLRNKRSDFDMPDKAFEKLVQTYKDKIRDEFDLPTKRAEEAIQALTLAGAPEHLAEITKLTIQTTNAKIDAMAGDLEKAGLNIDQIKAEATHQIIGNRILQSLQGLGKTIDEKVSEAIEEKRRQVGEARISAQSADINLQKAQLAPALRVPNLPGYGEMANAIQQKVESERAPMFPSMWANQYEQALRKNNQLQDQEAQLTLQNAQIAKERAGLNLVKVESEYKQALQTVTAMHWQTAQIIGGGPGKAVAIPNVQGGGRAAAQGGSNGIMVQIDQKILNPGVTPEELRKFLQTEIPQAIERFIREKKRAPQ